MDDSKIAWLSGQVSVLGMALQVVLQNHPNKAEIALMIDENYEQSIARIVHRSVPDEFLEGMKDARELFLLRDSNNQDELKKR